MTLCDKRVNGIGRKSFCYLVSSHVVIVSRKLYVITKISSDHNAWDTWRKFSAYPRCFDSTMPFTSFAKCLRCHARHRESLYVIIHYYLVTCATTIPYRLLPIHHRRIAYCLGERWTMNVCSQFPFFFRRRTTIAVMIPMFVFPITCCYLIHAYIAAVATVAARWWCYCCCWCLCRCWRWCCCCGFIWCLFFPLCFVHRTQSMVLSLSLSLSLPLWHSLSFYLFDCLSVSVTPTLVGWVKISISFS